MSDGLRFAVVRPLGLEAKELRNLLRERDLPIRKIELFDLVEKGGGAGTVTEDDEGAAWVQPFEEGSLAGFDVAFLFDADAETRRIADLPSNRDTRLLVVSGDRSGFPLSVTGIRDGIADRSSSVRRGALPTSTALFLARMLEAFRRAAPIREIFTTILEPASLAGDGALEEMLGQAIGLLNCHPLPKNVFGRQRIFNVFPRLAAGEIDRELAELFGGPVPIRVARLDGSSFHGHAVSLFVRFDRPLPVGEVEGALSRLEGAAFERSDFLPGPIEAAGSDELRFAPVEADPSDPTLFRIWMVADHLRVGPPKEAVRVAVDWLGSEVAPPQEPARKRPRR